MQAARRRRTLAAAAATAALVLTLGGCSGGDDPETTSSGNASSASPSSSASDSASSSPSSSSGESSSTDSASGSAAPADAVGSRTFTVKGTYVQSELPMRFDVIELKRRGDLLQLLATLTNTSTDKSQDLRWQIASRFQGTYRPDLKSTDGSFDGAILTDIAGKKRYLVATDSAQACVCTTGLSSTFVGAGQTVELNATYAAPPESTTQLDVEVATLGVFRDVPIS